MRTFHRFFLGPFLFTFSMVSAQKSGVYTHDLKDFNKAILLYNDQQYAAAKVIFEQTAKSTSQEEVQADCAYYVANCAIRTQQSNADQLVEHFVTQYPTSTKRNQAYLEVAHFYFEKNNFPKALFWFDKVDGSGLTKKELDQFNFQKGYSYYNARKKKEAIKYLNTVVNTQEYGAQAKYYLGFMAYEGDDYKAATQYFDEVSGEEKYKEKLSYFQADMNFKLGNFQKAIDLGGKAMGQSNEMEVSELNKIIGESYFNLKNYEKSIPYLSQYKGKKGKWNNTDFYQLGYAYYQQKQYESAIAQFNKIIDGNDFVAQNAYYHLGESYLDLGQKTQALNAFKNASEMDFNTNLQEDATLNYAKLSYEIGNSYESVPSLLMAFLQKYPRNSNVSEVEKLLIDSYISTKNYKEALVLLERNKSAENKGAYQKVLFYSGLESYTAGDYASAAKLFYRAANEPKDASITARATFWKAESDFVLEDFKSALSGFKQFVNLPAAAATPEFKNSNYNLGYASFKLKEYEQAATYFQKQIDLTKEDKVRLADAYLRLADCSYVGSKYWPAIDNYVKAIELKSVDADYAYFQKALSYGFLSKNDKKITELKAFLDRFQTSVYRDDVLFELGNTYVADKKEDLALKTYTQLITEFPAGTFTSKALLRQGLVYYNEDKNDLALAKFKKIAADFPKTPEALQAVASARSIYVDNGKVNDYATWVRTLTFVSVTDVELDNDSFEAADKQIQQGNTKQAMASLNAYVASFPNGVHALKANFNLAQAYYKEGNTGKAILHYDFVVQQPRSEFTEQSLVRLAQMHLNDQRTQHAIPALLRLENESDIAQNKIFAMSNLMKLYYETKEYGKAVVYADKVLAEPKAEERVKSDAQIIVARSAIQTGDEAKAKTAYAKLLPSAKGELAAEAIYYDAFFKNKDGKFEASNEAVQKLAKNYSSYRYLGAKGLVVMASNFYGLKDSFQATYILESVIKNFTDYNDVVATAQTELNKIKSEEAKTNSSIIK
ncbi:MAG: tetratricopeptide repeat protein [Flavobacterium sp.]